MISPKVLVLGSTGMLGRAVVAELNLQGLHPLASSRTTGSFYDAEITQPMALFDEVGLEPKDYVINCIGVTKKHIDETCMDSVARAVRLNVLFPLELSKVAEATGLKVIQVATDCVYSGRQGKYSESNAHDAEDVYGKSKSLGEIPSQNVMHLRCSLVGPEQPGRRSLFFEWVRSLDSGSTVDGFVNHHWNGLTSLAFSRVVAGVVRNNLFTPGVQHLVPKDTVTKYELVKIVLDLLQRERVDVVPTMDVRGINRTLATLSPNLNQQLFRVAGYDWLPSIREMMEELPWTDLRNEPK